MLPNDVSRIAQHIREGEERKKKRKEHEGMMSRKKEEICKYIINFSFTSRC